MTDERLKELLNNAIDLIYEYEHNDDFVAYLKMTIGITDKELEELGIQ